MPQRRNGQVSGSQAVTAEVAQLKKPLHAIKVRSSRYSSLLLPSGTTTLLPSAQKVAKEFDMFVCSTRGPRVLACIRTYLGRYGFVFDSLPIRYLSKGNLASHQTCQHSASTTISHRLWKQAPSC